MGSAWTLSAGNGINVGGAVGVGTFNLNAVTGIKTIPISRPSMPVASIWLVAPSFRALPAATVRSAMRM